MPLIRLVSHHVNNPTMIDKLIFIEGLPDDMFFAKAKGKHVLDEFDNEGKMKEEFISVETVKEPWEADVEANYPKEILAKFGIDREIYTKIDRNVVGPSKVRAFKIDYQTGPGEDMWKHIERILDRETPRDRKIPVPAIVGDRRDWQLDVDDVPAVTLAPTATPIPVVPPPPLIVAGKHDQVKQVFNCELCTREPFISKQALRMHNMKKHPEKKPVLQGV